MHITFSEILLILVVALIVIKPQQLPQVARTLGQWFRWMRQTSTRIQQEIQRPLDLFSYEDQQKNLRETKKETDEVNS
jgi:sec-independent protein translocase protein TatB